MTKIDFTQAQIRDAATLEREARDLRAQFLRELIASAAHRAAATLRGTPTAQH
jgi:hypothetical protein